MMSRRLAAVVTIVIVAVFVVVAVAPAFAAAPASLPLHARLVASTPADGSTVATADEVVLSFSEQVDATFVRVTVTGAAGSEAAGAPAVDGRDVTQALSPGLPAGEHVATYRVVSVDGHPVSGTVTFTTTTAASLSAAPTASTTPPASAVASAAGAPSPAATAPATAPASQGSSPGPWPVGALALVALVVVLAATVARRARRSDGTGGTPEDVPPVGAGRGPDAGHDPFA